MWLHCNGIPLWFQNRPTEANWHQRTQRIFFDSHNLQNHIDDIKTLSTFKSSRILRILVIYVSMNCWWTHQLPLHPSVICVFEGGSAPSPSSVSSVVGFADCWIPGTNAPKCKRMIFDILKSWLWKDIIIKNNKLNAMQKLLYEIKFFEIIQNYIFR